MCTHDQGTSKIGAAVAVELVPPPLRSQGNRGSAPPASPGTPPPLPGAQLFIWAGSDTTGSSGVETTALNHSGDVEPAAAAAAPIAGWQRPRAADEQLEAPGRLCAHGPADVCAGQRVFRRPAIRGSVRSPLCYRRPAPARVTQLWLTRCRGCLAARETAMCSFYGWSSCGSGP